MDFTSMITDNIDIILIIGAIILGLTLIKLATKILFRLIIILVIIVGSYLGYQQLLGKNIIDNFSNLYCTKENIDPIKCNCFVTPILDDLNTRFSQKELEALKKNKIKCNTEFIKSYKKNESGIKKCFEKSGKSTILEEILF